MPKVAKTRNLSTLSDRGFYGWLKSLLRKGSMRWRPASEVFRQARRGFIINPMTKRKVQGFECAMCHGVFPKAKRKGTYGVVKDHIKPVVPKGKQILVCTDKAFDRNKHICIGDVAVNRMYPELDGWQVLCHECNLKKGNSE